MLKIRPIAFVSTYCNCQFSKMVEDFSVENPDTYKFKCYLKAFNPIASSQLTTSASLLSCVVGSNSLCAKSSLYFINGRHIGRAGGTGDSRAKGPLQPPTCLGNYCTCAIITRGLYIFYSIFQCGLYCRAVYNAERLIFHDSFFAKEQNRHSVYPTFLL